MDAQTYYQNQIIKVKKSQLKSAKVMLKRAKEWSLDDPFFEPKIKEWKERVQKLNQQIAELHKAS